MVVDGEEPYTFGWYIVFHTKVNVVCEAVRDPVDVFPMWAAESLWPQNSPSAAPLPPQSILSSAGEAVSAATVCIEEAD